MRNRIQPVFAGVLLGASLIVLAVLAHTNVWGYLLTTPNGRVWLSDLPADTSLRLEIDEDRSGGGSGSKVVRDPKSLLPVVRRLNRMNFFELAEDDDRGRGCQSKGHATYLTVTLTVGGRRGHLRASQMDSCSWVETLWAIHDEHPHFQPSIKREPPLTF